MDLISIIVTAYNAEGTIERCLESLIAQTYTHLQIIVVDDGSTDATPAILDSYARKDQRIKAIHTENRGVSVARNTGLEAADGLYIGFADSDDWADADMFAHLHEMMVKEQADISVCGFWKEYESAREKPGGHEAYRVLLAQEACADFLRPEGSAQGFMANKLYQKAFFSRDGYGIRFDETLHLCEDLLCNCQILRAAGRVAVDPAPYYHYYITENNATNCPSYTPRKASLIAAWRKIWELTKKDFPVLERMTANRYVTNTAYITVLALHSGKEIDFVKPELERVRRLLAGYLIAKEPSFKYKLLVTALCVSPALVKKLWKLNRESVTAAGRR